MGEKRERDLTAATDPLLNPRPMTLEAAKAELSNRIYAATALYEELEGAGFITGNGHHARQHVVALALEDLERRWAGPGHTASTPSPSGDAGRRTTSR